MRPNFTRLCFIGTAIVGQVYSSCECGYTVNSTGDWMNHALFTDLLETDFVHLDQIAPSRCWITESYNVSAAAARGPYGKAARLGNVVLNPLPNPDSWEGEAIHGGDPGLQLWVRSEVMDGRIGMGEISSVRSDFSYGSYRVAMKLTPVAGTCSAFFWYATNSEEIDMEFLSSNYKPDNHTVNLVMQTPQSVASGFNAMGTQTYEVRQLGVDPTDGFHEYRFDWTPNKVSFYVDGHWLGELIHTYLKPKGNVFLNHWSNGDPHWSSGPPATDAVMTLSYAKLYFNSTNATRQNEFNKKCADAYGTGRYCQIANQEGPPILGETKFFNQTMCAGPPSILTHVPPLPKGPFKSSASATRISSLTSWVAVVALVGGFGTAAILCV